MKTQLLDLDQWKTKCDQFAEGLGLDLEKHEARIYPNISYALNDICLGLRRLYNIKKKCFYLKGQNPDVEGCMRALAKEGLSVTAIKNDESFNVIDFADSLDRESFFICYSVDDPALGRLYDVEALEAALAEKPLFRVRVSYNLHLYRQIPSPERNVVHCLGLPNGMALVLLGERVKFPSQGIEKLDWSSLDVAEFRKSLSPRKEDREKILAFEGETSLGFKPLLGADDARIYDRAAIYWNDMDSAALVEVLAELLGGTALKPPGEEDRFESLSLSRWGGLRKMDWLVEQGFDLNQIRGLLTVDLDCLNEVAKVLPEARQTILELQGHAE